MAALRRYRCVATLTGYTDGARRRRPVEPRVDCSSTPRGRRSNASPRCRTAASFLGVNMATTRSRSGTRRAVSASGGCAGSDGPRLTGRRHTQRGAGVQSIDCSVRRSDGRRSSASPSCRTTVSCPGRTLARSRCGTCRAAPASGRWGTRGMRRAGVQSNSASIARRRREGRRSIASPPCRTATSCPGRATIRSRSGTCRAVGASGRCTGTRTQRGAGVQSNNASIARRRREGRRYSASPPSRTPASCPGRATKRSRSGTRRPVSASGR